MASKAFMDMGLAITKAYRAGSDERKALVEFREVGLNVNTDRTKCTLVKKAFRGTPIGLVLGQAWNL